MGKLNTLFNRIYADYLMPSRLSEYEEIIRNSLENGFNHLTFSEYAKLLIQGKLNADNKYFIHRHDIDTDNSMAKRFFQIEQKYNIKASYYFRLSTLDVSLMQEIHAYGGEASYHFEEIATYCKKHHIKTQQHAIEHIENIRLLFKDNVRNIEKRLGYKLTTVASHGDFVNRKLGLINNYITNDDSLRQELGILAETYDDLLFNHFDAYISDKPYPQYYTKPIFEAITTDSIICLLTHPRQWRSSVFINTQDNVKRLLEGVMW